MARFGQLRIEDLDAEQRRVSEPIIKFSGGIGGPFNATLRSAPLTEKQFALGQHLLFESSLPRRLVEMSVLISARHSHSQLEWFAHERAGRAAGLAEPIIAALKEGKRPPGMTEEEAALYDFCVALLRAPKVSDPIFERAKQAFGERGVVELAHLVGFYGMISLVLKMAEVGAPDGSNPLGTVNDPFRE